MAATTMIVSLCYEIQLHHPADATRVLYEQASAFHHLECSIRATVFALVRRLTVSPTRPTELVGQSMHRDQ